MTGSTGLRQNFREVNLYPVTHISRHIHINGIVQGVGFRPFIYNLAIQSNLSGWVQNSASGVDIEVTGAEENFKSFLNAITHNAPPLAQIDSIETRTIEDNNYKGFKITTSKNSETDFMPVSPDMAVCGHCMIELFNPQDHRFRYPFINCTNCGPRFTIIKDIPYDRPNTTMAHFSMCPICQEEYDDPMNRRFHAQPIACPDCGPHVWIESVSSETYATHDAAIKAARELLANGKILAIKGLGGFHLACDASNTEAVSKLRERKNRPHKPFALMAPSIDVIKNFVHVTPMAESLLSSPQAPIVLLPKMAGSKITDAAAPGQNRLGFMLPYTPLHLLLLEQADGFPQVLVMTSGNLSEEPIISENKVAREKLAQIADSFLMHNRPIYKRIDDSVYAIIGDKPYPIRRARGYAPNPIRLPESLPQILATGPQMKNTFCLTREKYAFLSHYIGELENWETFRDYKDTISHFETLFRIQPEAISYDLHPDYLSTTYARGEINQKRLNPYPVQHHHAHLAACMVENHIPNDQKVAGLIFDGTGFGEDGTIWGGEVLIGNCVDFLRPYYLKPVPLPGGEAAIRKPARMALSTLWVYGLPWDENLEPVQSLSRLERSALMVQLEKSINTPLTSSMGRLFDAVSALIGVRQTITYEAQAAIELEAIAEPAEIGYYSWRMSDNLIDIRPTLIAILMDLSKNVPQRIISARFHNTIAHLSLDIAKMVRQVYNIHQMVLSGGVWQNTFLLEKTMALLKNDGIHPLIHSQTPANDGCVAFGQVLISAYRYFRHKE